MEPEKFSIRSRIKSFGYAISGIIAFITREHNARIHLVATIAVVIAAFVLKVTTAEAIALTIVTGLVWITEMLNTCIERMADMITRERNPQIKFIKDLAAGAVLVAAGIAVIVGLLIFIPKVL
ncbi:MAG: diacylglycerol kinase family protein [Bacteroidetes bacterium]|nr:diacylglycerol kinase family protein [Bacteroidota bacterium]